eukprot:GHVQ01022552.1.p2 GENE.GHVQ01022552.1~~GHVQ01022552.1.p2  ORF type:complete len:101 (-),score=10.44 GHVQ01022552.1:294-596(-)
MLRKPELMTYIEAVTFLVEGTVRGALRSGCSCCGTCRMFPKFVEYTYTQVCATDNKLYVSDAKKYQIFIAHSKNPEWNVLACALSVMTSEKFRPGIDSGW